MKYKYPFEKVGEWTKKQTFPDGHLLAKFSEPMSERASLIKCSCDCPVKETCKRHLTVKGKMSIGKPYVMKGNEFFCQFHIGLDSSGYYNPFKTTIPDKVETDKISE